MKKTISVFVAFVLVTAWVMAYAADYDGHWVYEDAQYLIDAGIIMPAGDGGIRPDQEMIRGEFVVLMNKIFRFQSKAEEGFTDLSSGDPYYADFLRAKKAGYITGNEKGEAKPNAPVTRAEVAVILARVNQLESIDKTYPESDVPVWASGAVAALQTAGIMKGNDQGEFKGYDNLTNAECYALGARILRAMPERGPDIYMVGDSTMCTYPESARPQTGWGEMVSKYMKENVGVFNHASGGRSSKSFIDEGRWDTVLNLLKPGDYVIIQFGHNDSSLTTTHYTDPDSTYREYLRKYVNDTREKEAIPIICTPVNRRTFSGEKITNSLGKYPKAAIEVAQEMNVFYVDLNKETEILFNEYGPEGTKKLFLFLEKGESPNYPRQVKDGSHFQTLGADLIAKIFAQRVYESECPLKKWVNPEAIN